MAGIRTNRRKAFTPIELLVVILATALPLSMVVPSVQEARDKAKADLCQQNLKQWGYIFAVYTEEHNGSFMEGLGPCTDPSWQECLSGSGLAWIEWIDVLRPYYKPNIVLGQPDYEHRFRCCPAATKPWTEGGVNPFAAWGRFGAGPRWVGEEGDYGSYGFNMSCCNPQPGYGGTRNWRTTNVENPSEIPVLLDSQWIGGRPKRSQLPPDYDGQMWGEKGEKGGSMTRFCLNRHPDATVNGVFMDWSVRKIGLKQLWKLEWHREYDENAPLPFDWPPWMEDFEDYGDG